MWFKIVERGPEAFNAPNLAPSCAVVAQVCLRVEGEESRRLADCIHTPCLPVLRQSTFQRAPCLLTVWSWYSSALKSVCGMQYLGLVLFSSEVKALEAAWANIGGVLNLILNLWRKKRNWIVIARDDVTKPPQAPCFGGYSGLPGWLPVPGLGGRGRWAHRRFVKHSSTSLISSVLEIRMEWVLSLPLLYKPIHFHSQKLSSLSCRID